MTLFAAFVVALLVSMLMIPPLMRLAGRAGFLDLPDARKIHATPIARIGGIAIVAGAVLGMAPWIPWDYDLASYLVGVAILFVLGVADDRLSLGYQVKFLGQVAAACVVVFWGDVVITRLPFGELSAIDPALGVPLTLVALIGVTNALNLADGLDGLAGGLALIGVVAIGFLAWHAQDFGVVFVCLAVAGATLGFLRYNTHPATVFMGDTGSQFLGYTLGVFAILLFQRSDTALSPAVALLVLGLPVLDTLAVMTERIVRGRKPFVADRNHVHHKLMALGLDHYEAVVMIYGVQALMVGSAVAWRYESDALLLGIWAGLGLASILALYLMQRIGMRFRSADHPVTPIASLVEGLRRAALLPRVLPWLVAVTLCIYLAVGIALVDMTAGRDVGVLALAVAGASLGLVMFGHGTRLFGLRLTAYAGCTVVAYQFQSAGEVPMVAGGVLVAVVAVLMALIARLTDRGSFSTTPLDFLVIALALAVPFVPEIRVIEFPVGPMAVSLVILYYAIELVVGGRPAGLWWVAAVGLVALVSSGLRAVF